MSDEVIKKSSKLKKNYKTIIEYLRGERTPNSENPEKMDRGKPYGVVVALEDENSVYWGCSICNDKDKWDKKIGLNIAKGRALVGEQNLIYFTKDILDKIKLILLYNIYKSVFNKINSKFNSIIDIKNNIHSSNLSKEKKDKLLKKMGKIENLSIDIILLGKFNTHLRLGEVLITAYKINDIIQKKLLLL